MLTKVKVGWIGNNTRIECYIWKYKKDYENLIVRVWGFSAYFNDLPENYKDLLIERALKNEGKSI